jgi:hypothetical protein
MPRRDGSDGDTREPDGAVDPTPPEPPGADAFCSDYVDRCGYGPERYTSDDNCQTTYQSYGDARKACVVGALAQAESTISEHCDSAAGDAPCD